jgi:hypothetical protein
MAGHVHVPAFAGYLLTAQRNLAEKLLDHRIWRYWQRENLWGNLRNDPDPIPRDNIMLSGFLAAQLGYARAASDLQDFDLPESLVFAHPSGARCGYSLPSIVDALVRQYERAPYGLLACEPNWIYPLCNAITATAIRCHDAQRGTGHWDRLEPAFRRHLEAEFITAAGRLVPFRSSLTGLAAPQIGGALMQCRAARHRPAAMAADPRRSDAGPGAARCGPSTSATTGSPAHRAMPLPRRRPWKWARGRSPRRCWRLSTMPVRSRSPAASRIAETPRSGRIPSR